MTLRKWILALALVGLMTAAGCAGAAVAAPGAQEDSNGDPADEGPQAPQANDGLEGDVDVDVAEEGVRPFLGLAVAPLGEQARERLGVPEGTSGLRVVAVLPDGPAREAGVERNDVLTAVNGEAVEDPKALRELVAALEPGAVVTLAIIRGGEPQDISITVGEAPEQLKRRGLADAGRPVLPGLSGLLGLVRGQHKLVDGQFRVMDGEGEIVTFNVATGSGGLVGEDSLELEKATGETVTFTLGEGVVVLKGGRRVELDALEPDDKLIVLERNGEVRAVVVEPIKRHDGRRQPSGVRGQLRGPRVPPEDFGRAGNLQERFERLRRELGPGADADGADERLERLRRRFQELDERIQERLNQQEVEEPETALQGQLL